MPFTAADVVQALRLRHSDALFIVGCKSGPTQSPRGRLRILDAWVLLRTWSPITTIGYEVKVSRSDWVADTKFQEYLPLCHQLYVVAPKGLVLPQELPPQVGLLEALHGGRLVTRVKAPRREIVLPENLVVYVLMARVRERQEESRADRIAEWKRWLDLRGEGASVGYRVRQLARDEFHELRRKLQNAENKASLYENAKRVLAEQGINIDEPFTLRERVTGVPNVQPELAALQRSVDRLRERFPARDPVQAQAGL